MGLERCVGHRSIRRSAIVLSIWTCSLSLCTPRCMRSSTALAWPRRSRRSFKGWSRAFYEQNVNKINDNENNGNMATSRPSRTCSSSPPSEIPAAWQGTGERPSRGAHGGDSPSEDVCPGRSATFVRGPEKAPDARRRDAKVNGADIYVVRVTKQGMGCAKPCWRCLEWARWAGVRRIFHWDEAQGRFLVVKVNAVQIEAYGTHSDVRVFSGLVRSRSLFAAALSDEIRVGAIDVKIPDVLPKQVLPLVPCQLLFILNNGCLSY